MSYMLNLHEYFKMDKWIEEKKVEIIIKDDSMERAIRSRKDRTSKALSIGPLDSVTDRFFSIDRHSIPPSSNWYLVEPWGQPNISPFFNDTSSMLRPSQRSSVSTRSLKFKDSWSTLSKSMHDLELPKVQKYSYFFWGQN